MKKLLIPAFCAAALLADGANSVVNSSFEMGMAGHAVMTHVSYRTDSLQPEITFDTATAVHGRQSLRIDNRKANAFVQYMSAENYFEPGSTVTYSVWLKAEKPVEVLLYLLDQDVDVSRPDIQNTETWSGAGNYVTLSTEWKRYSLTKQVKKPTRRYTLQLELQKPAMIWMDAVQFEVGSKPTPYAPAAPVEAAFSMDDHVLLNGKHTAELAAVNYTDKAQNVDVKSNIGEFKFSLPANSAQKKNVDFRADRFGTFSLEGTVKTADFSGKVYPVDYGVVGKMPKFNGGFFIGVNGAGRVRTLDFILRPTHALNFKATYRSNAKETIDEHFRNMRLSGFRVLRLHDSAVSWLDLEPEKGRFEWFLLDTLVECAEKNDLDLMFVLGNEAIVYNIDRPHGKNWFVRKNGKKNGFVMGNNWMSVLPDMKDWTDFVSALASRYKGKIRYYEVMNEPNLVMPDPVNYMRYLKVSHEIIKRIDPAAQIVGICSTGDFNGKTEEYIDAIGAQGGFKYFDILSFHPYDAPLDTAPNRAERQIERIHALAAKYRPGTPVLQDEIYYLTDLQKVYNGALCGLGWPAGNAIRRYAIDLAGGLVGSIPMAARGLEAGDAGHRNSWYVPRFAMHYVPRPHFIASNAFGRFLEGGRFLAKPDISSLLNSFVFLDRNGKEVALIWALTEDGECSFDLPAGVMACDLFGNPLNGKTVSLTEEPVYLFGSELKKKLETVDFRMKTPYRVLGAAESMRNGAKHIAVEFRNMSPEPRAMQARIAGLPGTRSFTVAADSAKTVYFPLNGKEQKEIALIVVDGGRLYKEKLSVSAHKTVLSGETVKVGGFAEFTPSLSPEGFAFDIRVTDSSATPRVAGEPWREDCVEFFFDAAPDRNLNRSAYTETGMTRLFLVPLSADGKPAALLDMKMKPADMKWSLDRNASGYTAHVMVPWKLLGATPENPPSFDLIFSDFANGKKVKSSAWAGGPDNHKNRLNFGRIGKK